MNIISWNCRGLGNHRAVLALHNLVKSQRAQNFVSHGDKIRCSQNGVHSCKVTF